MKNSKPKTKKRLPDKIMSVLALMQYGYDDLELIATATGMTPGEVREIEQTDDARIRRIAVEGVPRNRLFQIRRPVKCRLCGSRIYLVPCVQCHKTEEDYASESA